jgi:2-C-methyl-D-erythritol 4-phosphate cytidylyltransferase
VLKIDVIVASAGSGKRMGAGLNKLLLKLDTKEDNSIKNKGPTLLEHGLKAFIDHPKIRTIFLVVSEKDCKHLKPMAEKKGMVIVEGGKRRQDSVYNALHHINENEEPPDIILIQDGARIFCSKDLIERVIEMVHDKGSAIPVIPIKILYEK